MQREQPDRPLTLVPGWSGWAEATWHPGTEDEIVAYVRFEAEGIEAPLTVAELRLVEPWARRHRELPLGRIEHAAYADADTRFQLLLDMKKEIPGNDPVAFFRMKARVRGSRVRYELERPAKRRLDDGFYRDVARAYADAVHFGMNPRKTLASDSGIPADTVARWIRKAREKGYLTAAEPGKASGTVTERTGDGG